MPRALRRRGRAVRSTGRPDAAPRGGADADSGGGFAARDARRAATAACVIDASIAIKWVVTAAGTEAACRLGEDETTFHAPDLVVPETGNILWKQTRRRAWKQAEAAAACGILRLTKIKLHAMPPQAVLALEMAAALDRPVYDTTYLALAPASDMPFVTADRRLVNKRAAAGNPALPKVVLLV